MSSALDHFECGEARSAALAVLLGGNETAAKQIGLTLQLVGELIGRNEVVGIGADLPCRNCAEIDKDGCIVVSAIAFASVRAEGIAMRGLKFTPEMKYGLDD